MQRYDDDHLVSRRPSLFPGSSTRSHLEPTTILDDVTPLAASQANISSYDDNVYAPETASMCAQHQNQLSPASSIIPWSQTTPLSPPYSTNVQATRLTTVRKMYFHPIGTILEYPETMPSGFIGHMLLMDPSDTEWPQPGLNIVYSQGIPMGSSKKTVYCEALLDEKGNKVPCRVSHSTCQGCKVCPHSSYANQPGEHCSATLNDIRLRVQEDLEAYYQSRSPERDVFQKTLALWSTVQNLGCTGPTYDGMEAKAEVLGGNTEVLDRMRRGHEAKATCSGRVKFDYNPAGAAFIRCEHWAGQSKDHIMMFVSDGHYDMEYLRALFHDDKRVIKNIEEEAFVSGFGPMHDCSTIYNCSSNKVNCPVEHRDGNGNIIVAEMIRLPCSATFRVFVPQPEYRKLCPKMLLVCGGSHSHPIPLPTKTPHPIRNQLVDLLQALDQDLPDLTPRRLLRHPALHVFLRNQLPNILLPTLGDLHPSLSNRDHVRSLIDLVRKEKFPHGTSWDGLLHLKTIQDRNLPLSEHYIRYMAILPSSAVNSSVRDADDDEDHLDTSPFRIIVCMSPDGSRRLQNCQYLQSDIAFKRVAGYLEFELGAFDRASGTTIVFCRIYLNRQTARAHKIVFDKIDEIVKTDTGMSLRWRHLHARSLNEHTGILQWAADQHGGQAKGLGLHLKAVAAQLPPRFDLHEPHKLLTDLSEYEHLHRLFRLCEVHVFRNIRECKGVSEEVKIKMRSLVCTNHIDWDGTVRAIEEEGGKEGTDWVYDKTRSKFAFEAMCWSKSHIPKVIWQAGDANSNIIEGLHADVNQEGKGCSLVGAEQRGHHYDNMKMKTLVSWEQTGIRPSYRSGHVTEMTTRKLKRKANQQHKTLNSKDIQITKHNKKLETTLTTKTKADSELERLRARGPGQEVGTETLRRAEQKVERAATAYAKALSQCQKLVGTGSGLVNVRLPVSVHTSTL